MEGIYVIVILLVTDALEVVSYKNPEDKHLQHRPPSTTLKAFIDRIKKQSSHDTTVLQKDNLSQQATSYDIELPCCWHNSVLWWWLLLNFWGFLDLNDCQWFLFQIP